jgi:hypothetical protein
LRDCPPLLQICSGETAEQAHGATEGPAETTAPSIVANAIRDFEIREPGEEAMLPLDMTSMLLLQTQLSCSWPSIRLPQAASTSDESALQPWITQTRSLMQSIALLPLEAPDNSDIVAGVVQLQHACSAALGMSHNTGSVPPVDSFLLLVHQLMSCQPKTLAFCTALMQLPSGPYLWPAFGAATRGSAPILQLTHAVRCMLADEHHTMYTLLSEAAVFDATVERWLRCSLLCVLPVDLCVHVAALSIVGGPVVLVAVVVAVLVSMQGGVQEHASTGNLGEWMPGVTFFDVDAGELLWSAVAFEGRHRMELLPMLMQALRPGSS